MRIAFFFDQSRCMACNTCAVACKDWNLVNPGPVRWRTQITHEDTADPGLPKFFPLSMSCNHCENPACVPACPLNAIEKREDGVVAVDRNKCQSLQLCVAECPFATPKLAGKKQEPDKKRSWLVEHPMQKCDHCRSRIDNFEQPVCVAACPCHALDSGDFDSLKLKYPDAIQVNTGDFPYAYKEGGKTDTKPMFLIRKRKTQAVSAVVP